MDRRTLRHRQRDSLPLGQLVVRAAASRAPVPEVAEQQPPQLQLLQPVAAAARMGQSSPTKLHLVAAAAEEQQPARAQQAAIH